MLLRICLIIAVVGGLAAAVVNFVKVKEVITTTIKERDDEKNAKVKAQDDANKTHALLTTAQRQVTDLNGQLAQTKRSLADANTKVSDLENSTNLLSKRLDEVSAARSKAEQDLAQFSQLKLTPQQIEQDEALLKKTTAERDAEITANKLLVKVRNELKKELEDLVGTNDVVPPLPAGLKGKVLAVDPKYSFVVLDIGDDKGVVPRGVMMVARDGKFVGKVQIERVLATQSVANVMPAWTSGKILEGDQVFY
ncbi:MAG: hypothetical protein ABSA47_06960 [Verrucomicrobiota bacterium]|jgi:hypothetical protein